MAIITISRGSQSRGKEVAEKVAERLRYACISREILLDASEQFSIPELKLQRAIHDAPSILDRFTYGKEKYIAYIQAALLKCLKDDKVVYHGLAGHFFLQGISHVLKVRIIVDLENRLRLEMEREGVTREEALRTLKKEDEQRHQWSRALYGIDTRDPSLYDLVIRIKKISVQDVVEIICHAAQLPSFATTASSRKAMDDRCLAAQVKAAIVHISPSALVSADGGRITITVKAPPDAFPGGNNLALIAGSVRGVEAVTIDHLPLRQFDE
jgi:cytidylate kinase